MRWKTRITCALIFASCSHFHPRTPSPAVCLEQPPPSLVPPVLVPCPPGLVLCLDQAGAIQLTKDLEAMTHWIADAWLRCGPTGGSR
jgi:hypothetical protein